MREPDRDAIGQALARAGGVVAQAAAELGLSRQALYRRMERLGIARPLMSPMSYRSASGFRCVTRWSALVGTLLAVGILIALALDHLLPGKPLVLGICLLCVVPIAIITIRSQISHILSLFRALKARSPATATATFPSACTGRRTTSCPT
jgi:hypothetical protein